MHYEQIALPEPAPAPQVAEIAPVYVPVPAAHRRGDQHRAITHELRAALQPFVDLRKLRRLAASGADLQAALTNGDVPDDVQALIIFVAELLRPIKREPVKSPADAAGYLMARMGLLDQEELWTLLLNTKNGIVKVHRVYQGSLNASLIRVGEVFREAIKLNCAALILAHNHPTGQVDPSPEDVLVTTQIVQAGQLLDVDVLDHLILGRGQWLSMKERGLGFGKP